MGLWRWNHGGTTSAYAENTKGELMGVLDSRNYLRVRGEYPHLASQPSHFSELPPRTRRIRLAQRALEVPSGTTSAYAENTLNELGLL